MFEPWWFGPFPDFVRNCWNAPDSIDFLDTPSDELLQGASRALTLLAARGNEGLSRRGMFSSGGEPERSRIQFYNTCRVLQARSDTEALKTLIRKHVVGAESFLD